MLEVTARIALIVLAVTAVVLGAQAPPDEATELKRRAAVRIKTLQQEADRLASRSRTVFNELRKLEIDRQIQTERVNRANVEVAEVTAAVKAASARVAALEAERVAATPGLEERLVAIYKRGRGGYARLLFEATDVREFGRLSRGVAAVARLDHARIEAHRRMVTSEREALTELDARRGEAAKVQVEAMAARAALDQALAARTRMIEELDQRRDLAAKYVGELETAQAELTRTVSSLPADGAAAAPTLPLSPFRGDLEWPVQGRVLSRFGKNAAGRFGTSIVRNGIEVAAKEGTPARAVHGGTVGYAGSFSGFGTLVIVDHGASAYTLYGHLATAAVSQGRHVRRGDVVGTVGTNPTGDEALYFELRVDGRPVDPLQWLRSAP
jgi:septal ring factor EnvC (AmiA/AmiB activator)